MIFGVSQALLLVRWASAKALAQPGLFLPGLFISAVQLIYPTASVWLMGTSAAEP